MITIQKLHSTQAALEVARTVPAPTCLPTPTVVSCPHYVQWFTQTVVVTRTVRVVDKQPTLLPERRWTRLSGEWLVTYYSDIGRKHGAAWQNQTCVAWHTGDGTFPDLVDTTSFGLAMPGEEFYCLPIRVCVRDRCAVGTAVDVPRDYKVGGRLHADLWPAMAEELGIVSAGVVTDHVSVWVGQ